MPTCAIGTDAFQECDTVGITRSATKHNELVMTAQDMPMAVRQAFHIATTGRPGPTLIDVPKDCLTNTMEWYWPTDEEVADSLPGYRPNTKGHPRMIKEAAKLIMASERPILYVGGGVLKARAAEALRELAELTDIHVVTTLMARGAFPDDHPLCLGMPGMHGNATAITAMQKSRPADQPRRPFRRPHHRQGRAASPPRRRSSTSTSTRPSRARCAGPTCRSSATPSTSSRRSSRRSRTCARAAPTQADTGAWKSRISGWREQFPLSYEASEPGEALKPQYCLEQLRDNAPEGTILVSGVGQHQMWSSQYWRFNEPYTWVNSGGLGTMGFSVPAAIGAKVGRPDRTVWAIDGDGCFQMTAQELVTAAVERIPVKVGILNNSYLGMVRQWQEMFYDERYSEVYLSPEVPDFVKWAEAMGCVGIRVDSPEEVQPAIDKANSIDDRPVVVDFRVDAREKVFPMVPAGFSNDDMLLPASPEPTVEEPPMSVISDHPTHHILSVLVQNRPGVLARVAGLFARRGFNIFSLAVAPAEDEGFSRITIVVDVESTAARADRQAAVQADRGREDQRARPAPQVERELLLATVRSHGRPARPGGGAGQHLRGQDPCRRGRGHHRLARRPPRQARRF